MLNYVVMVANGEELYKRRIVEVDRVVKADDMCMLYDEDDNVLFVVPIDSMLYLEVE